MHIEHGKGLIEYQEAMARMDTAVADVLAGGANQAFFLEHTPCFTVGTSGTPETEIFNAGDIPVIATGRGGKITYHGPGQRIVYVVKRLDDHDVRAHIRRLQAWLVASLADLGIIAFTSDDVGVWVNHPTKGACKIAAIGVRVRKWVAFHGIALNVNCDLAPYSRIIPCGIIGKGITTLAEMGWKGTMVDVDAVLEKNLALIA